MTSASPAPLAGLLTEYGLARSYSLELVDALDEDQLVWRPHEDSSAVLWHLGHQAAVNHYMVRNLTAAESSFSRDFDALFDSATPEPARGGLPPFDAVLDYRRKIGVSTAAIVDRIARRDVAAPEQLAEIAAGLLRAVINHEYQHATWVAEVRATLVEDNAPLPRSQNLVDVGGYWMLA